MKHELNIIITDSNEIKVECGDFEAEGFTSGFVLFHALRNAFLNYNEMDLNAFSEFIKVNYDQLKRLPNRALEELDKTFMLFEASYNRRFVVFEWENGGSFLTSWNNYLEVIHEENSKSLIYSVSGFEYDLEGMGWEWGDDNKSIINHDYLELSHYLQTNNEIDFNSMIDYSVYDETGKCVFLIERGIVNFKDSKILNALVSDINDNILPEDEYYDAQSALKNIFS